ncbi:MAG: tripartite tricarboxylate transporter substrate binding protein [Xanthobacteraceae bacterium]|nr:tripartite tricarboxylate transporter substrate binding protein [Xanthobacteraceae bacterium]
MPTASGKRARKNVRRCGFAWLVAIVAVGVFSGIAYADDKYPTRPIRVVVPYAAGGADSFIRPLQNVLEKKHGIVFTIESVVGAGGIIGANQVKRSAPDGYTLLFCGSGALTIGPKLYRADYTIADFDPVLNLISIPYVLAVRKDAPYRSFGALIEYIRHNPGHLTYGSSGMGSAPHLAIEAMAGHLGLVVTHVPFSGVAPAVTAIVGGHIDAVIGSPNVVLPQVASGNLVSLAISSRERFEPAPEIPTFIELGVDVEVVTDFGFLAPKGTPRPIIDKLAAAIRDAAADPDFLSAMAQLQNRVNILSASEYAKTLDDESAYFGSIIAKLPRK